MRKKRKNNRTRSDLSPKKRKIEAKRKATVSKTTKVPKTRAGGTLTKSEYFAKIRGALRRAFRWWRPMINVLDKASRVYKGPNKLQKKEYQCNKCSLWFKRKEVQIDHVEECGQLRTFEDVVPFIRRLTREEEGAYQVLCRTCHKKKTKEYLENRGSKE